MTQHVGQLGTGDAGASGASGTAVNGGLLARLRATLARTDTAHLRRVTLGRRGEMGLFGKIVLLVLALDIAIIYLYPLFQLMSTMLMSTEDILNPTIKWIPTEPQWINLDRAIAGMQVLRGPEQELSWMARFLDGALVDSILNTIPAAVAQVFSAAVAGYAFGRLRFPGRRILFVVLIFTLLIPPQTLAMPLFQLYRTLGLLDTPMVFFGPALFGHGIRGALFVIIYSQFFRSFPKELEEAAEIDGASPFYMFRRVMFPLAKPAMVVVFLFSLVWHWNETYLTGLFFSDNMPLSITVESFKLPWGVASELERGQEPILMAASFLLILPLILTYFFVQRWFIESLERTGISR
jgi:multiple sugar transport system permease protein